MKLNLVSVELSNNRQSVSFMRKDNGHYVCRVKVVVQLKKFLGTKTIFLGADGKESAHIQFCEFQGSGNCWELVEGSVDEWPLGMKLCAREDFIAKLNGIFTRTLAHNYPDQRELCDGISHAVFETGKGSLVYPHSHDAKDVA